MSATIWLLIVIHVHWGSHSIVGGNQIDHSIGAVDELNVDVPTCLILHPCGKAEVMYIVEEAVRVGRSQHGDMRLDWKSTLNLRFLSYGLGNETWSTEHARATWQHLGSRSLLQECGPVCWSLYLTSPQLKVSRSGQLKNIWVCTGEIL